MSGPSEDPEAWNAPRPARSRPPIHALLVLYRNVDSGELRVPTRRGLETIQDDSYQRVAGEARVAYLPDLLEEASAVEANPGSRYVPISHQLLVAARYGNRCAFPGCLDKVDEVHHVQALSEGGASQADNLVPTCALHHDALHSGWVQGRREASDAWVYARPGQEPEGQGPADLSRKRFRQRP